MIQSSWPYVVIVLCGLVFIGLIAIEARKRNVFMVAVWIVVWAASLYPLLSLL